MSSSVSQGEDNESDPEKSERPQQSESLVRILKTVRILPKTNIPIDDSVVSPKFYNGFNYSILAQRRKNGHPVVGVTSANKGEGKTLVASNLAVSLALAGEQKTVLVDLSVADPRLHRIFGTHLKPGLTDALTEGVVQITETQIPNLYLLPAGGTGAHPLAASRLAALPKGERPATPSFGIEQIAEFRNVVYSLREAFDFVIIDLPSMREPAIPMLLTHQMDGLLVVVDSTKTKREEVEIMFQRVHHQQLLGFVFNRVNSESLQ